MPSYPKPEDDSPPAIPLETTWWWDVVIEKTPEDKHRDRMLTEWGAIGSWEDKRPFLDYPATRHELLWRDDWLKAVEDLKTQDRVTLPWAAEILGVSLTRIYVLIGTGKLTDVGEGPYHRVMSDSILKRLGR